MGNGVSHLSADGRHAIERDSRSTMYVVSGEWIVVFNGIARDVRQW